MAMGYFGIDIGKKWRPAVHQLNTMSSGKNTQLNPWIVCTNPKPQARLRLFCFPYAGAGASIFHSWSRLLPPEIELCSIQFPGREGRLKETPYRQLLPLVEALSEALQPYLDKPFALFGHSMGALISFETTRHLRQRYSLEPVHLFVSGRRPPHLADPEPILHTLPDLDFIQQVQRRYNGIPQVILQDRELMQLFLPVLRADFQLFESYHYTYAPPFNCPISAFGGRHDQRVTEKELASWRDQTLRTFNLQMFPGGHFFLQSVRASLLQALTKEIVLSLDSQRRNPEQHDGWE
jgi:medium-chain acyl-[acyl-carrier-protein] hydrolase